VSRRWLAVGAYAAAIYATLPVGPTLGRSVLRSAAGGWLLGPGVAALLAAGAVLVVVGLVRRAGGPSAYALLAATGLGYAGALAWLSGQKLERIHLPEYGLAAWLAFWAAEAAPPAARFAVAAVVAAAIGWGDELLQRVVPGRVYDVRDVAANALGAVLGLLVLATVRAAVPRSASDAEHEDQHERDDHDRQEEAGKRAEA
jgi:hypothetical protein